MTSLVRHRGRSPRAALSTLWALTALAFPAGAQQQLVQPIPGGERDPAPGSLRERVVDFDLQALEQLRVGEPVALELFEDASVHARLRERADSYAGGRVLALDMPEGETGSALFSIVEDNLEAQIDWAGARFTLRGRRGEATIVAEVDPAAEGRCGSTEPRAKGPVPPPDPSVAEGESAADKYLTTIDLMVPYTQDVETALGGEAGVLARINLAVALTNEGFAVSGVIARVNLVHAYRTDFDPVVEPFMQTVVNVLQGNDDGQMDEVHFLRNLHAADIVLLLIDGPLYLDLDDLLNSETGPDIAGIAFDILCDPSEPFEHKAFAVSDYFWATGNFTFQHEIGHLLGARHDTLSLAGSFGCGITDAGFGAIAECGEFRTVMAYPNGDHFETPPTRMNVWSTPQVLDAHGHPYGIADALDNAEALNTGVWHAANWRAAQDVDHSVETVWTGGIARAGAMVDLLPRGDLSITGVSVHLDTPAGESMQIQLWLRAGGHVGHEEDATGWTLLDEVTVTSAGPGEETYVSVDSCVPLLADERYGLYVALEGGLLRVSPGQQSFENNDLRIETGVAKSAPLFSADTTANRQWNGAVHYTGYAGNSQLSSALADDLERARYVFQLEVDTPVRLHGFDVDLVAAQPSAVDVFVVQGSLSPSAPDYQVFGPNGAINFLGSDVHLHPDGNSLTTVVGEPRDLAPGVYLVSIGIADPGVFGQALRGSSTPAAVEDENIRLEWGFGYPDGFLGHAYPGEGMNVRVRYSTPSPTLEVVSLAGGTTSTLLVEQAAPDVAALILTSLFNPHDPPLMTPFGDLCVSASFVLLPAIPLDVSGSGSLSLFIPPGLSGWIVQFHGLTLPSAALTNPLAYLVQ